MSRSTALLVLGVALGRFTADGRFGPLAVGSRGRGFSRRLLGRVAARLAAGSTVPVLIVAAPAGPAHSGVSEPVGEASAG